MSQHVASILKTSESHAQSTGDANLMLQLALTNLFLRPRPYKRPPEVPMKVHTGQRRHRNGLGPSYGGKAQQRQKRYRSGTETVTETVPGPLIGETTETVTETVNV